MLDFLRLTIVFSPLWLPLVTVAIIELSGED